MEEKKKIVGIVPTLPVFEETENRYEDVYRFNDTYPMRAMEAGMLPIGVLPVYGRIRTDILDMCDAFILQGGTMVRPYHIEVIDHALKNGKKLLGICLGCQSIQCYFATKAEAEKRHYEGSLADLYAVMKFKEGYSFLGKSNTIIHRPYEILPRNNTDVSKHPVQIVPESLAAEVFGASEIMGASYHILRIETPAPGLVVSGTHADGTVEIIEYGDTILGTQFHPDADEQLPMPFAWLAR